MFEHRTLNVFYSLRANDEGGRTAERAPEHHIGELDSTLLYLTWYQSNVR